MPNMRWMSSMDREEESSSPSVMDNAARICHHTKRQNEDDVDGAQCSVASSQELAKHTSQEVRMNYNGEGRRGYDAHEKILPWYTVVP